MSKLRLFGTGGFSLVEIMVVVAIISLLAAVAIPNVMRGRTSSMESRALGNMRALVSSMEMYRSNNHTYPGDWDADMYGADCNAGTGPDPDFGPQPFCVDLSSAQTIGGYQYQHTNLSDDAYAFLATPLTLGSTGTRSFYVDQSGLIEHCTGTGTAAHFTDGDESDISAAPTTCD